LNIDSANDFLSITSAQLDEVETDSDDSQVYTYNQSGSVITGWDLVDPNGNPIATSTLQDLFGVPVADTSDTPAGYTGTDLTPINPGQPFVGLNGGWYFAAQPAQGAYATWADAFFNWGSGIAGYSPRNLIPYFNAESGTGKQSANFPGTSAGDSASEDPFPSNYHYTLTYSPETSTPPYTGIPVNLAGVFNTKGIVLDGTKFSSTGGLDGAGAALSAQTLKRTMSFNNVLLNLDLPETIENAAHQVIGGTAPMDVVSADGQIIALPSGTYTTLTFLGTAVEDNQPDLKFTVNYTNNTQQPFHLAMSAGTSTPQYGDYEVTTTHYVDRAGGTIQKEMFNVYGYKFTLESGKTVQSITLPKNPNVKILAMTLS
jgi:hypothetical protein